MIDSAGCPGGKLAPIISGGRLWLIRLSAMLLTRFEEARASRYCWLI